MVTLGDQANSVIKKKLVWQHDRYLPGLRNQGHERVQLRSTSRIDLRKNHSTETKTSRDIDRVVQNGVYGFKMGGVLCESHKKPNKFKLNNDPHQNNTRIPMCHQSLNNFLYVLLPCIMILCIIVTQFILFLFI